MSREGRDGGGGCGGRVGGRRSGCRARREGGLQGSGEFYKLAPTPPDGVRFPLTRFCTPSNRHSPQTRLSRNRPRHHVESILARRVRDDATREGPPPADLEMIRYGARLDRNDRLVFRREWSERRSVDRFAGGGRGGSGVHRVGSSAGEELGWRGSDSGK